MLNKGQRVILRERVKIFLQLHANKVFLYQIVAYITFYLLFSTRIITNLPIFETLMVLKNVSKFFSLQILT